MREEAEIAYYDSVVRPLLGGDVEYLGEVAPDERDALLGSALALVNPIAWPEPFGMVMIESLATGTPVLTTPLGAAPEIVDDGVTGFLRGDVAGLADAVGRLGEIDRRACRAVVETRFSAERMVDGHLDLYASLTDALYDPTAVPVLAGRF
jgi:glycosyltransferase involved in cell wall biosynthesis